MIHCDTELRFVNAEIGFGVFATRRIPKGTITWVRDRLDQAFTPEDIERDAVEAALAGRTPVASVSRNFVDVMSLLSGPPAVTQRTAAP